LQQPSDLPLDLAAIGRLARTLQPTRLALQALRDTHTEALVHGRLLGLAIDRVVKQEDIVIDLFPERARTGATPQPRSKM
jgi:hypothetical protein